MHKILYKVLDWRHRHILAELGPPLLLGLAAALTIVGLHGIDPANIGWNSGGDAATHYLGWAFFRGSPWEFPLGANPAYGLEIGSSIFYSDSIPLMAFAFKPFDHWLPHPFQYLGIWTALCLMLQAWFAWRLLGCVESLKDVWLRLPAAGLFVFSPPMIIRISGHSALVAHWLILAGVYLYVKGEARVRLLGWPALALVTSLIHSYLFVMVAALWCADFVVRIQRRESPPQRLLLDVGLVLGSATFGLWQAGFFMVHVEPGGGYGEYGMNLLALINPDIYSHVLKPIAPELQGFHEGFNFIGLGSLILIPMLLPVVLERPILLRVSRAHWPLIAVLFVLSAFAVSNVVWIGMRRFMIPLPAPVVDLASVLRASGRMFWPAYYVLLFTLIVLLSRSYSRRSARGVLLLAFILQVTDTSEGWGKQYTHFKDRSASAWSTPLQSGLWKVLGSRYRKLRRVPLVHYHPDYSVFAYYASAHGMATDSVYLARVDPLALAAARESSEAAIASGNFASDTLYILDRAHASLAADHLDPELDLLTQADGYFVLAPGWKKFEQDPDPALPELTVRDVEPGIPLGRDLFFGVGGDGVDYLKTGWSRPEPWGVWSQDHVADLDLPVDPRTQPPVRVDLQLGALLTDNHPAQDVECWINSTLGATLSFNSASNFRWQSVPIPSEALSVAQKSGHLRLRFKMLNPGNPKALGLNEDTRDLGVAMHHLKLSDMN
jgi:hypothetical protein